jgi:hypothetical protein
VVVESSQIALAGEGAEQVICRGDVEAGRPREFLGPRLALPFRYHLEQAQGTLDGPDE